MDGQNFGWEGNSSFDDAEKVINDISVYKSIEDCPYTRVGFRNKHKISFTIVHQKSLTPFIHPYGRCCQITLPER